MILGKRKKSIEDLIRVLDEEREHLERVNKREREEDYDYYNSTLKLSELKFKVQIENLEQLIKEMRSLRDEIRELIETIREVFEKEEVKT